ncbi:hypothetical protein EDB19DRAFT_1897472 [Suillus lakei]|nr:hypothetical protein EDB19DRAFT_1897472 [Suillus lakei]
MHCLQFLCIPLPADLDGVRDIMPKPNRFVYTMLEAYNNCCTLILRPDDIWTTILIQFSFFVAHEGKEELIIIGDGTRHIADFALMARQMLELMHTRVVDPMLMDSIMSEFSTTTDVDRTVYAMSMMATMEDYSIPLQVCTRFHDWEAILERLERLKLYSIETVACPKNPHFWFKVVHYKGGGSGPTYLSGWITFCVSNEQGVWQVFRGVHHPRDVAPFLVLGGMPCPIIDDECVPCGYAHLDVKLDDLGAQICSNDKSELLRNGMRDSVWPMMGDWYFITRAE